jgi:hypothetical protein
MDRQMIVTGVGRQLTLIFLENVLQAAREQIRFPYQPVPRDWLAVQMYMAY